MSIGVPKKGAPPAYGGKRKVTLHVAPRRRKAYMQLGVASFPKVPCPDPEMTSQNATHTSDPF